MESSRDSLPSVVRVDNSIAGAMSVKEESPQAPVDCSLCMNPLVSVLSTQGLDGCNLKKDSSACAVEEADVSAGEAKSFGDALKLQTVPTGKFGWDAKPGFVLDGGSVFFYEGGYCGLPVAPSSQPRIPSTLSVDIVRPAVQGGSIQRMWEGSITDVFDNSQIALQTACLPCLTFGKNMERAGFGTCFGQGSVYFLLILGTSWSFLLFIDSGLHLYLYTGLTLLLLMSLYLGYYRGQIRKRFNISGSNEDERTSVLDDHLYHVACGCCTLCQEARTLTQNNVQNGVWHGPSYILAVASNCHSPSYEFTPSPSLGSTDVEQGGIVSSEYGDEARFKPLIFQDHPWNLQAPQSIPLMDKK